MELSGILLFTARASAFALVATALWLVISLFFRRIKLKSKRTLIESLFVFYAAALIQITVIRDFSTFLSFSDNAHTLSSVVLIPFSTTIGAFELSSWQFIYHLIGNMIWFVPFGFLAPMFNAKLQKLKLIILSSALLSLYIEILQFIFNTGISDIDDIILNTLGALLGFIIYLIFSFISKKFSNIK